MAKSFYQLALEDDATPAAAEAVAQTVTDTIEQSDNREQVENISNNIEADIGTLNDQQEISDEVKDHIDHLEELLEQPEEQITNDDIVAAQEAVQHTFAKLGYSLNDVKMLRASNESFTNKKEYLGVGERHSSKALSVVHLCAGVGLVWLLA